MLQDLEERKARGEFEIVAKLVKFFQRQRMHSSATRSCLVFEKSKCIDHTFGSDYRNQLRDNLGCIEVALSMSDDE
ncbi:MAG: hypothetical protein Ct9H90mP23_3730 [Methanobacteriota archaeon]|nr:MAG: hypothetical protein Ct9H90mP23_3730 [Euryarchaeota archaeon]